MSEQVLSKEMQEERATSRHEKLVKEQAHYTYLPNAFLMSRGGYTVEIAGNYEHARLEQPAYRLVMLSQTSVLLLFRDDEYIAARTVRSDEEFLSFLVMYDFPLPK